MLRIWTDGACRAAGHGGPGGWAFVAVQIERGVIERRSGGVPFADSGRMELLAVVEALNWARGRRAEIFTDSHYVARGFNKGLEEWRRNNWRYGKRRGRRPVRDADLWRVIWERHRNVPATISQLRRSTHTLNVEADQAAKEAMRRVQGPSSAGEQKMMHVIDNLLRGC